VNDLCSRCQGKGLCGKPCPIYSRFSILGKIKEEFSGSSPPSVFVGRIGYPNVFAGILAPTNIDENSGLLDSPEQWYSQNASIHDILGFRSQMIYSRFRTRIKSPKEKLLEIQQQVACSSSPCEIEVRLSHKPSLQVNFDNYSTPIANPANIEQMKLTGNPKIPISIDKVTSDVSLDAASAAKTLYTKDIPISSIQKIFSSGLLGVKIQRKLVPTRWSVTATDDIIGLEMIERIMDFHTIGEYRLFSNTYLGNHYEILLMPRQWSYDLVECKFPGSVWNPDQKGPISIYADYESVYPRKHYADNTVGGYYASRLAVCEYLTKISRQASALVLREVTPDYFAPLGVWVCRETCRHAFDKNPVTFSSLESALGEMKQRMKVPWKDITSNSNLLREIRVQKTLRDY
jgi:hypothetical protein